MLTKFLVAKSEGKKTLAGHQDIRERVCLTRSASLSTSCSDPYDTIKVESRHAEKKCKVLMTMKAAKLG